MIVKVLLGAFCVVCSELDVSTLGTVGSCDEEPCDKFDDDEPCDEFDDDELCSDVLRFVERNLILSLTGGGAINRPNK